MSPLRSLLARVRQRLRGLWLVATLVWIAPLLAAVALALVVLGRLQPWAWTDPAAIGVALAGIAAVAVAAVALRVPDPLAARAADRGLDARDLVATALEREEADGPFDEQVRARAEELAREADLRRALPVRVRRRRLALAASLAALAVVAGVAANPQDEVRRQRAVEQARIDAAAEAVEEAATELAEELDPAAEADAVAELEALAEALADASSIGEAEELLDRAEAALEAGIPPESLARKAALSGLEDGLAAEPLPGAPSEGDAASQLEAAADAAGELTDEETAELAERLERLAATQAVGNPAAAAALGAAAAALRAGDDSAAGQALRDAAAAQRAAGAASASDDARRAALGAVGSARERLAGEGRGEGDGEGEGDGQGQGAGQGQGQGEGDGQGEGQGAGQGQGGSPSGQVAGSTSGTGAGQGGQGTPGGTGDGGRDDEGARTADPAVFDPEAGRGDEVDLGGTPTGGNLGEVVGRGDGASAQGSSYVPLSQAIDRFQQRVTRALDDPALSPSMRELVRAYFTRLTEGT